MSVAIVTGASQGFGRALAEELADDGWDLVVDARHQDALEVAAAALRDHGGRVVAVAGDVADPVPRGAGGPHATGLGGLDLLVNNASTLGHSHIVRADYPLEELEAVYRTNSETARPASRAMPRSSAFSAGATRTSRRAVRPTAAFLRNGTASSGDRDARSDSAEQPTLRVYRFDPGDMRTQMHQDAFPGEDISDRPEPGPVVPALLRLLADAPPRGRYQAGVLLEAQP
jgi:hypothetical protein